MGPGDVMASQSETVASVDAPQPLTADVAPASEPLISSEVQVEVVAPEGATASQPQAASTFQKKSTASNDTQETESNSPSVSVEVESNKSDEASDKQDEVESPPSSEAAASTERKSQPRVRRTNRP